MLLLGALRTGRVTVGHHASASSHRRQSFGATRVLSVSPLHRCKTYSYSISGTVSSSSLQWCSLLSQQRGGHQRRALSTLMVRTWNFIDGAPSTLAVPTTSQKSSFSSKSGGTRGRKQHTRFQLDALPFSISPEQALDSFRKWAENEQGLTYLMNYSSVRIGAAYVPVWSFDINVRFKVTHINWNDKGRRQVNYNWKPDIFSAYGNQSILHIPGLSAYAGYSYRRSLINPIHSTSLVFMGHRTERFGGWMLQDMTLQSTGGAIPVVPDAWNATKGRAFAIVREELESIAQLEFAALPPPATNLESQLDVQTELVTARRVMMPTFVIDYSILGLDYRAFVSGCDDGADVSGVSHLILGQTVAPAAGSQSDFHRASQSFVSQMIAQSSAVLRLDRLPFILRFLQNFRPLWSILLLFVTRIFTLIPILGVAGGALAGFRKILQPWMDARSASADWERQREHEALMSETASHESYGRAGEDSRMNDFTDTTGAAKFYFSEHREQILRHLSGNQAHQEGTYDWYKDWQEWARQQWEQQQQQQQQQQGQSYSDYQQQQRTRTTRQQSKPEFQWDFDPNDPYSVLGIHRGATKSQVSAAFRTEMLAHHPDTQPNASEGQKRRAVERSKLISEAYRKIKAEMKR